MGVGGEAELAGDAFAEGDEFGDVDGEDFAGVESDEEVARASAVGELVVGVVGVDEDLLDDAGVLEEADGAVDGGFGDAEVLLFECGLELIGLEEVVELEDGVEDLCALGGVLEAFAFEAAPEDGAEWFGDGGRGHDG